ncbi:MAG: hypothetical protein PHV28_05965 [Kiritimatiellae bacterium]|nr:hypothetical protein [Kiritimatiellia bacterium]
MNFDGSAIRKIAPSMRRALLITAGGLALAAALVFFVVCPTRTRLKTLGAEIGSMNATLASMRAAIADTNQQKAKTAALAAELDAFIASGVIEPLLGSFAMRGKSLLDPFAQESGFVIDTVKELPFIPLQVPSPAPIQLHGRQPVEFSGHGSYPQITAFISCAERSLPLATLSSLLILGQPQTPEVHKAIVTFEWPAKGEKRKP